MKLSATLPYGGDVRECVELTSRYEAMGFDMVWVPEVYTFDSVSLLGALTQATSTIGLGSAILPLYSRTPTLLAMTAAGLDALSDGRFTLGLGVSGPQVVEGWHGVEYRDPLALARETVDICRTVWRREVLTNDGPRNPIPYPGGTGLGKPLKLINTPVRERIPIHLAALGPKNVELTAEIADGWLPAFFHPEKASEVWGESLAAGRESRVLGPLEITAGCLAALCDPEDVSRLRDEARARTALYVGGMGARGHNFYNDLFARYGYERQAALIQDLFLSGRKEEAEAAIPDSFLEQVHLVGDEAFVADRVAAYRDAGVTMLDLTLTGPNRARTVEFLAAL